MSKTDGNDGRGEFQERVKRDGSWDQFMRLRDAQKGAPLSDPEQSQPDGMPSFADMSAKGDVSFLTSVRWVSERLGFPDAELDWDSAPSATAVSLMRWAKRAPGNQDEFWLKYGPQLLPPRASQTEAESEAVHKAACLTNEELCDRFAAICGKQEAD